MPADVTVRRERLMVLPFEPDPRASRPRPLRPILSPAASLAGVPPALRERVGRGLVSTAFPYAQALHGDGAWQWRDFTVVELSDERWSVVVCPDLGGRVLRVLDRRRGRDLLLQPAVLNQGVIGLTGAWFVGGIEFNAFRYGHNIHGLSRVATERLVLADGRVAVRFGAYDELFGCRWAVTIALGAEQVALRVQLDNCSDEPQPDYWWTTLAVPARRDTRILGAPGPMLHHGMFRTGYQHDHWPRLHGRDWSRWREHHEILSGYFYENRSDVFGYAEADGFAFVHQADASICRGRKLWSISAGRDDTIWSDRLLEPASTSYLELQSGLNPMQVEAGRLAPGETRAWTETIGAVTLCGDTDADDYDRLFETFEQEAKARLGDEYSRIRAGDTWRVREAEEIVAADPRLEMSRRIVEAPATVSAAEVAEVVAAGWVAGARWRARLRELEARGELDAAGALALAAAELDAGGPDAGDRLQAVAAGEGDAAGWADMLLGHGGEAATLRRAWGRLRRVDVALALDEAWARAGRHEERAALWAEVPAAWRARDDVRIARAAGALARGEWAAVRAELAAPLPAIPEGSILPWTVWRESFVGEASAQWAAGDTEAASHSLFLGGQAAPQFGVGRDEAGWGVDLLYYRWRLARAAGRALEAALLLTQAAAREPYAGSVAALHRWRWLREAGHALAEAAGQAVRTWEESAGQAAVPFDPWRAHVRAALAGAGREAWQPALADPVYGARARWELAWEDHA